MSNSIIITGTQISYYNICHRKLWLFSKNISTEHTSELVEIGNIIHENSYSRSRKEVCLEGIKVDLLESRRGVIHEVKKSRALEAAHLWQLRYYLYYFKTIGVEMEGIIDYPKIRRRDMVILTDDDSEKIKNMLAEICEVLSKAVPPQPINKPYCKKCSYYEFCYC
jgi:CRISPR-associated exonuclease Cas4